MKRQVENHLKQDKKAFVTTLIDYYGVCRKYDFPAWVDSKKIHDKSERLDFIETKMYENIDSSLNYRFIPYLQLHEFEGLLFNDINIFYSQFDDSEIIGKDELITTFKEFSNPEMINNDPKTAPSKRLERIIAGYNKVIYGNILAEEIGLKNIRAKCPRFNAWIEKIENI